MNFKILLLLLTFSLFSCQGIAESVWDKSNHTLAAPTEIIVYRSPACGCCHKWVEHLRKHKFTVNDVVTEEVSGIKTTYGVPGAMASCHTAIVDGYVIEGHVPAADIIALITKRPKIIGISVPAMPAGTPGMEMGSKKDPFKVLAFDREGNTSEFNDYKAY